ncbi:hypothetical protein NL676_030633 [Syzygium grande]|nr:hypothetical protein NL676_030633 [Syzygium grande]
MSLALDKTGGCWSRPTEAAAPGSKAGDRMPPAAPITIPTLVSACALIIARSTPDSLTFPIVVDPRTLAVDSESGLDKREASAPVSRNTRLTR